MIKDTDSYLIEIIRDEGGEGFAVMHPELRGCISCAKSVRIAIDNLQDAKRQWLMSALSDGYPVPKPVSDCNFFRYRGCFGSIEYSERDDCFHGKIINTKASVSYEGESIAELAEDFVDAVDDYLDDC